MSRPYNFSAGPAVLPSAVLKRAQAELVDWQGSGISVLETGHRTPQISQLIASVENKLRTAMQIPANYRILFLHGGAQGQFAAIPMNLLGNNSRADYLVTGVWSYKAAEQAKAYGDIHIAADGRASDYLSLPAPSTWRLRDTAEYVYYCDNETITGLQFPSIPEVAGRTLIADLTSSILTAPLNVEKFGLLFASGQKNLSISGVTVVIIRDDLLQQAQAITPNIWHYQAQAKNNSCLNTPPVYGIYMLDCMLDWLAEQGGVEAMAEKNQRKADKLYAAIDASKHYQAIIANDSRSNVNISFHLASSELEQQFLLQAETKGLCYLKGHKLLGGIRASLYNAMPEAGVDALIRFMQDFEKTKIR